MIRCLIIKTSSLGDIVHTLPALTDAVNAIGNIQFDWVVEENFQEIPSWHPAVNKVIPIALRRWRKTFFKSLFNKSLVREWKQFHQQVQKQNYDYIIDAQGLLKSALITRLVNGKTFGLDKNSAREPIASRFYQSPISIAKNQHAVERIRQLFAKVFDYKLLDNFDYGIIDTFKIQRQGIDTDKNNLQIIVNEQIFFFHGTTWETKHWPEIYWLQLANQLTQGKYQILLPWGNISEKQRAERIKEKSDQPEKITILEKMTLKEIAQKLSQVKAVVAVDTGLAHLAAALDKPLISLFGPTNPVLTRPYAANKNTQLPMQVDYPCKACMKKQCSKVEQIDSNNSIQPACYSSLSPRIVSKKINQLIDKTI